MWDLMSQMGPLGSVSQDYALPATKPKYCDHKHKTRPWCYKQPGYCKGSRMTYI